MKTGRVIGGDEHDARVLAQRIVDDARAEAETIRGTARAEAEKLRRDAGELATRLVQDARVDAERTAAQAAAEAARVRDAAQGTEHEWGAPPPARAERPGRPAAGSVDEVVGLVLGATVPGVALGEIVRIDRRDRAPLAAEVVGFRGEQAVLLPLGDVAGVAPAGSVWRTGAPLSIRCGEDLLGRVLDGIGAPLDDGPPLGGELWAVDRPAPAALSRPLISAPQPTGVRVIDTMLTLGRGQRVGLFAAAGVGKSTLLGQIARGASADVIVLCLVGERGRELVEFLREELAPARQRTVVVCATSDAPPLVRLRAIHTATAIAEWFRDRLSASVLLLCDSLTRVARAQREVGLSAGEPPARHGYPPSVFALLPRLIERTGATPAGVITAIYTVLVAGNDLDEPIADEVRGLVDGHIVLDRRLAQRGHFPPVDVVASVSRMMARVVGRDHAEAAARIRARLAIYEEHRDLITLGAYQPGRDRTVDDAVKAYPAIEQLFRQPHDDLSDWDQAITRLLTLAGPR
ncbi:MAG TPA: FliI/YscN family ATPase [Kofleriaceae bacterium]|jgi:type III secretion protein N (ATPase)|nr:FliI/YscN family ATPase [Kofleriaceae bacterium]